MPGENLCRICYNRRHSSFAVPGRDVASLPSPAPQPKRYPERAQDRDLTEISRCLYCGTPFGGHTARCWGRIEDLDSRGFEYHEEVDL